MISTVNMVTKLIPTLLIVPVVREIIGAIE